MKTVDFIDPETDEVVEVGIENNMAGICLSHKGAGNSVDDTFLLVEAYEGNLNVYVWADPEEEDFTHKIVIKRTLTQSTKT